MKRRIFFEKIIAIIALPFFPALLWAQSNESGHEKRNAVEPINRPHEEWRGVISPEAYQILFEERTEKPGSSELNHEQREGTFICAACYLPLFESQHKYESGTGWPSFTQPIPGHIGTKRDFKLIFLRTEYHCARCGGHQGHVFNDWPPPRGERWCNNGLALKFVLKTDQLPELRG